jgi:hypothetical protein
LAIIWWGNQLFQIANCLGITYSCGYDYGFCIDDYIPLSQGNHPSLYIPNLYQNIKFVSKTSLKSIHIDNYLKNKINNVRIFGFYHNDSLFSLYRNKIINTFKFDQKLVAELTHKYNISINSCSIHIRRGDYLLRPSVYDILPIEYYQSAISKFPENTTFYIFSDDIAWCKLNFIGDNFIFAENNLDYVDLCLMTLCTNNVLSNSTFSWWGGYLNQNKNKTTISPIY